jgi:site-specific DNA-methyltransferase (adenine-specific)
VYNLTIDQIPAFDTLIGVSHNTQKPVDLLKRLIEIFTDEGDVVIDPVAGSGTTLIADEELNRRAFGFEIKKDFYRDAVKLIDEVKVKRQEIKKFGYAKTELSKTNPILF